MNRIAAILIVVGATTSVMAAPFRAISFEAGGGIPNVTGEGFTTSGAGFYNRQGGANANTAANDVTTWAETSTNHSAYDSYFTVSRVGPSRLGSADDVGDSLSPQLNAIYGDATTQASGIIEAPDNHIGHTGSATGQPPYPALRPADRARGGVANQPIGIEGSTLSYLNPLSGQDGIFVGQLTVNRGATLSGGFLWAVLTAQGNTDSQNLTLNEVKTIISRVGEGTKLVFTGDVQQIDNPYLDASSNGLSYAVERMKGLGVVGHVTLAKSERSELASLAIERL